MPLPSPDNGTVYDAGGALVSHALPAFTIAAGAAGVLVLRVDDGLDFLDTCTDDKGGIWTPQRFEAAPSFLLGINILTCLSHPGGNTVITAGLDGSRNCRAAVQTYTGVSAIDVAVVSGQLATSTTNHTSGNITTSNPCKIVGVIATGTGPVTDINPNNGETKRRLAASGRIQIQDKDHATAGTYNQSWVFNSANDAMWGLIALRGTGGNAARAAHHYRQRRAA